MLKLGALRLSVFAAVVGFLVALTACGGHPSPSPILRFVGDAGAAGVSMPAVRPNTPWLFGTFQLCLDKAGSVTPTDLTLVHTINSMRVVDWGFQAGEGTGVGAYPGSVKDLPDSTHNPITAVCGGMNDGATLDVSVKSTDPTFTWARGFELHYRSGSRIRTVYVPFYIELCSTPRSKPCDHMDFNAKP